MSRWTEYELAQRLADNPDLRLSPQNGSLADRKAARHVEHQRAQVRMTPQGHVDDEDVESKMRRFLDSQTNREGRDD